MLKAKVQQEVLERIDSEYREKSVFFEVFAVSTFEEHNARKTT